MHVSKDFVKFCIAKYRQAVLMVIISETCLYKICFTTVRAFMIEWYLYSFCERLFILFLQYIYRSCTKHVLSNSKNIDPFGAYVFCPWNFHQVHKSHYGVHIDLIQWWQRKILFCYYRLIRGYLKLTRQ